MAEGDDCASEYEKLWESSMNPLIEKLTFLSKEAKMIRGQVEKLRTAQPISTRKTVDSSNWKVAMTQSSSKRKTRATEIQQQQQQNAKGSIKITARLPPNLKFNKNAILPQSQVPATPMKAQRTSAARSSLIIGIRRTQIISRMVMEEKKSKSLWSKVKSNMSHHNTNKDILASSANPSTCASGTERRPTIESDILKLRSHTIPSKSIFLFRHNSVPVMYWRYLVAFFVILEIILEPLYFGFNVTSPSSIVIESFVDVCFAMDFILQFFLTFMDIENNFVVDFSKRMKHYVFSIWFLFDFLSCIPFQLYNSSEATRGYALLRLICVTKLLKGAKSYFYSSNKVGLFRLVKLITVIFVLSHWVACIWSFCATEWADNIPMWNAKSITQKYIVCYYTAVALLLTSPPPTNSSLEDMVAGSFIIVGAVVQASVFGSVASLIASLDEDDLKYNKKIIAVYQRCNLLGIPDRLRKRIEEYYKMLWIKTKCLNESGDSFIEELSPSLICEIKFHLFKQMVLQIPFLSQASSLIVEKLVLKLQTVTYIKDDMIMRKGEYGDWMGFIGQTGCVGILDPTPGANRIIRILENGDYIGEISLLLNCMRTVDVIAITWLQMYVLHRVDFDATKLMYPEETRNLEDTMKTYVDQRSYIL